MAILYIMIVASLAMLMSATAVGMYRDIRDASARAQERRFEDKTHNDVEDLNEEIELEEIASEDYCQVFVLTDKDMIPPIRRQHGVSHQLGHLSSSNNLDSQTSRSRCSEPESQNSFG